ncbi:MAG: PIN domain-containing protein [Clostridiales Family XIII bacterium]|jgi:predicted nucleic acid-binding protein|nr:PIN domain-containing protein [Clostridiales Family XIII bacterium]
MKLYLDTCCYNRPFDDQSQDRIHLESEAVLSIVKRGRIGKDSITGSDVLNLEIGTISNIEKKDKVSILYEIARRHVTFDDDIEKRAAEIMNVSSIRSFDALHIASAEVGEVDYMLTTDDKLEKAAAKLELKVKVTNPLKYIAEVIEHE